MKKPKEYMKRRRSCRCSRRRLGFEMTGCIGGALVDLDLYQYSILIERVRISSGFSRRVEAGNVFPFDAHYRLGATHCQQLNSSMNSVPRLVGAPCPRPEADGSEDHACWMATLFTPLRCPGRDCCADPLQCSGTLMRRKAGERRPTYSFAEAWRARRAEIRVHASRGERKTTAAKRIPVAKDSTLCKRWAPSGVTLGESALQRATVHQLFSCWGPSAHGLQRVVDLVLELWGVPTGHHAHQLHLSEFCAYQCCEVISNMCLSVEARNTAKQTAEKRSKIHLVADDDGGAQEPSVQETMWGASLEVEDVGGEVQDEEVDREEEEENETVRSRLLVMTKVQDVAWIERLLAREKEIARARQPGRSPDECKAMHKVDAIYGDAFKKLLHHFPTQESECLGFDSWYRKSWRHKGTARRPSGDNAMAIAREKVLLAKTRNTSR